MAEEDRNREDLGQGGGEAAEGVGAESCDQSALRLRVLMGEGKKRQLQISYMA